MLVTLHCDTGLPGRHKGAIVRPMVMRGKIYRKKMWRKTQTGERWMQQRMKVNKVTNAHCVALRPSLQAARGKKEKKKKT